MRADDKLTFPAKLAHAQFDIRSSESESGSLTVLLSFRFHFAFDKRWLFRIGMTWWLLLDGNTESNSEPWKLIRWKALLSLWRTSNFQVQELMWDRCRSIFIAESRPDVNVNSEGKFWILQFKICVGWFLCLKVAFPPRFSFSQSISLTQSNSTGNCRTFLCDKKDVLRSIVSRNCQWRGHF